MEKRQNIYIVVRLQSFKSAGICHKYAVPDEKTTIICPYLDRSSTNWKDDFGIECKAL